MIDEDLAVYSLDMNEESEDEEAYVRIFGATNA